MSLETSSSSRREWILGNPWSWLIAGLLVAVSAWLWVAMLGDNYPGGRHSLVVLALLLAGAGVTIRLSSSQPPYFQRFASGWRPVILLGLGCLFSLLALAISGWLLCALFGIFGVTERWGPLFMWWIFVAPIGYFAAAQCFGRLTRTEPLDQREETALLLLLAALTCYVASWALFVASAPLELDTLRFFLAVLTLVPLIAAPLMLTPPDVRFNVISLLVLIHFGGITLSTLAAPPASWIVSQTWNRLYRPYLEFMYLTNAYHFYAPDPGPATYLWCRILYEDPKGQALGKWYKVPMVDEQGNQLHPVGLAYQRHLAITEVFTGMDYPAIFYKIDDNGFPVIGPNGNVVSADFYIRRVYNSPLKEKVDVIGKERPRFVQSIPFHAANLNQQYRQPAPAIKTIMKSFALHVIDMAERDPELKKTGLKVTGVKIYRVIHPFASQDTFLPGLLEPNEPDTYLPFFYGEYNLEGELTDPNDPFLYWLLPTQRFYGDDGKPIILAWAIKHAGDAKWVRDSNRQWVEDVPQFQQPPPFQPKLAPAQPKPAGN